MKLNFRTLCVWFLVAPIHASSLMRDLKSLGQTASSPKNACGRATPNVELVGDKNHRQPRSISSAWMEVRLAEPRYLISVT